MSEFYPLTFEPEFRSYIWGGRNLAALGRRLPAGIIAESWEISGHPATPTRVKDGPLAGRPLNELVVEMGLDLLGRRNRAAWERRLFPVLIKLLDATQKLSVQVHPDDAYATAHEGGEWGKTEMWYVLAAGPSAQIIYGLRAGVTSGQFRAALAAGDVESCLHYMPVRAGDAVFVPAGAVHALLGDAIVMEIQQTSDITYRVFDWNRPGADGKPRPLHIERALDAIDFDLVEPAACQPGPVQSVAGVRLQSLCHHSTFAVDQVSLEASASLRAACEGSTFEIWVAIAGGGEMVWVGGSRPLPELQFTLLPAALGPFVVRANQPATFLRIYVE